MNKFLVMLVMIKIMMFNKNKINKKYQKKSVIQYYF